MIVKKIKLNDKYVKDKIKKISNNDISDLKNYYDKYYNQIFKFKHDDKLAKNLQEKSKLYYYQIY